MRQSSIVLTTRRWTQCKDMSSSWSFFAVGELEGKVFVAGGHDGSKNALNSAWVYDLKRDEWIELTRMSEERDECQGIMIGTEFWVVSGYDADGQRRFERWAKEVWVRYRNGDLICWAEYDSAVQVGSCGVNLGDRTLVTGSEYKGAPQGFFLVERKEG